MRGGGAAVGVTARLLTGVLAALPLLPCGARGELPAKQEVLRRAEGGVWAVACCAAHC